MYPYLVQGSNIIVVIDGKSHTISKSHISYDKLKAAIVAEQEDVIKDLIEPKKVVLSYGAGNVSIQGDTLFWKGKELHNSLSNRMVQMIQEDFPVAPLVAFMENLYLNPSKRAVTELYGFLEKNTLPITTDGCFLAYKKVRIDYLDCHSQSVLNKPAAYITDADRAKITELAGKKNEVTVEVVDGVTVVSMPRNEVDDDQKRTCSVGLHICSKDYLKHFGGERIIVVKVNPRDVVSIPNDYNDAKGRVCRYEIVDEIDKDKVDEAFAKSVQEKAEREASAISAEDLKTLATLLRNAKQKPAAPTTDAPTA